MIYFIILNFNINMSACAFMGGYYVCAMCKSATREYIMSVFMSIIIQAFSLVEKTEVVVVRSL